MKNISSNTLIVSGIILISTFIIGFLFSNYGIGSIAPNQKDILNDLSLDQITDEDFETTGCDRFDCLFTSDDGSITTGYTTIQGYYTTFETEGMNGEVVACDGFAVTNGQGELVDDFWYEDESVSAFGIFFSQLSDDEQKNIENSTIENPIEVGVISQYRMIGKGAPACFSNEQIISIKE